MILLNGEPTTTIDALDRGLHYGDGLFETIAVHNGTPLLWERHMARLRDGCLRVQLPVPESRHLLAEVLRVAEGGGNRVAKIVVTRGAGGRGYRPPTPSTPTRLVFGFPWPTYAEENRDRGVAVRLCRMRLSRNPALAGLKHLNRIEQVIARSEWGDDHFAEGLMLDTEGQVVEGTMSNLFLLHGGALVTPPLDQCGIAGVMRAQVIATAEQLRVPVKIGSVSLEEAWSADGLFLTNSLFGIWPIRQFDERTYGVDPLVSRLQQQLQRDRACV